MKKVDLLSLFFFDPLHPTFDYLTAQKTTSIITEPEKPLQPSSPSSTSTQSAEISSEDHTDPADISLDDSLHDEVDTSSNTTECELACGCTSHCWCDYVSEYDYDDTEYGYEPRSMWDDMSLTGQEVRSFEMADEWEGKQRTKNQRNGKQHRAKRAEKKDKVSPKRYVNAVCYRKKQEKDAAISEHVCTPPRPLLPLPPPDRKSVV